MKVELLAPDAATTAPRPNVVYFLADDLAGVCRLLEQYEQDGSAVSRSARPLPITGNPWPSDPLALGQGLPGPGLRQGDQAETCGRHDDQGLRE